MDSLLQHYKASLTATFNLHPVSSSLFWMGRCVCVWRGAGLHGVVGVFDLFLALLVCVIRKLPCFTQHMGQF